MNGLAADQLPRMAQLLRTGWLFVIPLFVLIYALFSMSYEPGKAGIIAVVASIALGFCKRDLRAKPGWGSIP